MKLVHVIPAFFCLSAIAAQSVVPFEIRSSYKTQLSGKPNVIYWQAPPVMQNCRVESAIFNSRVDNIGNIQLLPRETTTFALRCSNIDSGLDAVQTLTVEIEEGETLWDEAWDWGHHANHALFENILNPLLVVVLLRNLPLVGHLFAGGHGHGNADPHLD